MKRADFLKKNESPKEIYQKIEIGDIVECIEENGFRMKGQEKFVFGVQHFPATEKNEFNPPYPEMNYLQLLADNGSIAQFPSEMFKVKIKRNT
jgi:hypothetical protein